MNIELDECIVQHLSDDALELSAGGVQSTYRPTAVWYMC